jgi:hypothetical protein
MTWKEDVEAALEQLLNSITVPLQAGDVADVVPRSPVRTPAPTSRSALLAARGTGRCAAIGDGSE